MDLDGLDVGDIIGEIGLTTTSVQLRLWQVQRNRIKLLPDTPRQCLLDQNNSSQHFQIPLYPAERFTLWTTFDGETFA